MVKPNNYWYYEVSKTAPQYALRYLSNKSVTISSSSDRWFISLKTDIETQITEKLVDVVGVNLGIKSLATLSTGEVFPGAKSYRKLEAKLSRLQYLNRNKVKFSNNWKKAQLKIARVYSQIANIRKDTLHKLTTSAG